MKQGEIWFVEFTGVGHEYQGKRPAVIIEGDKQIKIANIITVMPFTSQIKKQIDDIFVPKNSANNLFYDSVIKVHEIQSFDIGNRFIKKIGVVEKEIMEKIKAYLRRHFEI
jgi:mRNA-degrading endonuclease toxin of MazEF toxin-antitoxin module